MLATLFGTAFFLPNEVSFKIANLQGDFAKAKMIFPHWKLLAENNELGELYAQKKYMELVKKLDSISEKTCNIQNEKISEFCTNIFYLNGLTKYQLGKDEQAKKQKPLFEKAIAAFTKVMMMTPEDSQAYMWSKENIAFLQQKFAETQQKEKKEKDEQKSGEQNESGQNQNGESQNQEGQGKEGISERQDQEQRQGKQESGKENNKQEDEQKSGEQSSELQKNQEEGRSEESDKKSEKNENDQNGQNGNSSSEAGKSRLPKQMQQALEQTQKNLEEEQKSQQGFNRSQSAAEKNTQNTDPLDAMRNDPFFQDFFGNDPFFQDSFGKKNFHKNIQNPNEKDW